MRSLFTSTALSRSPTSNRPLPQLRFVRDPPFRTPHLTSSITIWTWTGQCGAEWNISGYRDWLKKLAFALTDWISSKLRWKQRRRPTMIVRQVLSQPWYHQMASHGQSGTRTSWYTLWLASLSSAYPHSWCILSCLSKHVYCGRWFLHGVKICGVSLLSPKSDRPHQKPSIAWRCPRSNFAPASQHKEPGPHRQEIASASATPSIAQMTTFPSPLHAGSVPPISLCTPHCWHSHGVLIVFTDPSPPCAGLLLRPTFLNERQKHLGSLKFRCLGNQMSCSQMTEAIDEIVGARPKGPEGEHDVVQRLRHPVQDMIGVGVGVLWVMNPFHNQASSRHP